jgi:hypothetical protein
MDAMEFFRRSAGKWRSQRTTHHLAFRRAELGDSEILVETLDKDHPQVVEICKLHQIDPAQAVGGAFVSWQGSMEWDQDDQNHSGSTVFALVPETDNPKAGKLIRERGYAEIVPVAGLYEMDEEEGLILVTEYETMSVVERFWFASPDLRLRTSTVTRFGGFSTASFCSESRIQATSTPNSSDSSPDSDQNARTTPQFHSAFGW